MKKESSYRYYSRLVKGVEQGKDRSKSKRKQRKRKR